MDITSASQGVIPVEYELSSVTDLRYPIRRNEGGGSSRYGVRFDGSRAGCWQQSWIVIDGSIGTAGSSFRI